MSAIDNYGDFELPEEKTEIEIVEDPVEVISSQYDLFKKVARSKLKKNSWMFDTDTFDSVYKAALKLFEEKEELKVTNKELEKIIEELRKKAENCDGTGLFLSAMINSTKINTLFIDEFSNLDQIGYDLKENKTIVLGRKVRAYELGLASKGNTINFGKIYLQGNHSDSGLHINKGKLSLLGLNAINGVNIKDNLFGFSGNPVQGGVYIDYGRWDIFCSRGIPIDFSLATTCVLKQSLQQKLNELDFLDKLENMNYEQALNELNSFDWKKFENDIKIISERIKRSYGR